MAVVLDVEVARVADLRFGREVVPSRLELRDAPVGRAGDMGRVRLARARWEGRSGEAHDPEPRRARAGTHPDHGCHSHVIFTINWRWAGNGFKASSSAAFSL